MKQLYKPTNPSKVLSAGVLEGSARQITLMKMFDLHPSIQQWGFRPLAIPYRAEDGILHLYHPSFLVIYAPSDDTPSRGEIVEVATRRAMVDHLAKWEAAEAFAVSKGLTFKVIFEDQMTKKGK